MSFTDQKPFIVTEEHTKARWCGYCDARMFRCAWCGHKFQVGDTARWVFTNDSENNARGLAGNPFICDKCDGPRGVILAKLAATREEFMHPRFWWFREDERNIGAAYAEGQS